MEESKVRDYIVRIPSPKPHRGRATPPKPSRKISISATKIAIPVLQITHNPAVSILAYCFASISMTIVNKYCVSGPEWNMNFFLLAFQSTVCIIVIQACKSAGLVTLSPLSLTKARKWFPISLLLVAMTYTGAKSLQYLSVPVYTIFKNLTIIVIAYGEVLLFGAAISSTTLLSFGMIVLSSIVAAWADIQAVMQAGYDRGLVDEVREEGAMGAVPMLRALNVGYAWMGCNVVCSAAYVLGMRKVIRKMGFRDWDTMYYNNLLNIPILTLSTLLFETWSVSNLSLNFPASTRTSQISAMVYSGLCAIFISYASAWCIRITSSTTYSMVGALNKLPIAVCGLVFFNAPVTIGGVVAILMGFVSGVLYAWAKNRQGGGGRGMKEEEMVLPMRRERSRSLSLGGGRDL